MSKPKDSEIPAWQRILSSKKNEETKVPKPEEETEEDGQDQPDLSDPEAMLFASKHVDEMPPIPTREQAQKFLEHPGAKDAALEDKVRFLEVKGVKREDIEALLPGAKDLAATTMGSSTAITSTTSTSTSTSTSTPSTLAAPAPSNPAPVITYPEFLMQRKKPPPLITSGFLLNTLYATTGTVAGMYALSKWLLSPMHEALTDARHDLFTQTSTKLDDLNSRLEGMVSKPLGSGKALENSKITTGAKDTTNNHDDDDEEEEEEEAEDMSSQGYPTEQFLRDIGTQTSPDLAKHDMSSSSDMNADSTEDPAIDVPAQQENRLKTLVAHVRDLETSRADSAGKEVDLNSQLDAFAQYLNEMVYTSPYHGFKASVPAWNTAGSSVAQDEFDKFKAEIRGIKGVMLSTRNFPRSGGFT